MTRLARRGASVASAVLLSVMVSGCGGSGSGPAASTAPPAGDQPTSVATSASADPTVAAGRTYTHPPSLCQASDLAALTEMYPQVDDKPLADTNKLCATFLSSPSASMSLSVDMDLAANARLGQAFLDTGRRILKSPTHDITGVGSDAYWTGGPQQTKLVTYDGNLVLTIIASGDRKHPLPTDIAQRLGRVANGTFDRLTR